MTSIPMLQTDTPPRVSLRWVQLLLGLVCMMAISSPQYVWTLFTKPLGGTLGASAAAVQTTFSILIVLQTFFSPFQGWLIDRFGPRLLVALGAGLTGLSWVLASSVNSLLGLYMTYGLLGGLGTGIVYVGVVGLMVAWFPANRGFAVGVVAAGYGMGAVLTTFPISHSMAAAGLQTTLWDFGIGLGAVGILAALGLRRPPTCRSLAATANNRDTPPGVMLKTPLFWLMFVMMTLMATTGLMVTSQLASFATDFGVSGKLVLGLSAVPLALTIDRFCNGLTRPFFGWVSDRLGREPTMALAFGLEALAMILWLLTRSDPLLFVMLSGVVFFGWGEIFSLFPSTLTDSFGSRHATTNYGCLYIAQGIGAIFGGPMASLLHQATQSWTPVFAVAVAADLLTALLALVALRPARERFAAQANPVLTPS